MDTQPASTPSASPPRAPESKQMAVPTTMKAVDTVSLIVTTSPCKRGAATKFSTKDNVPTGANKDCGAYVYAIMSAGPTNKFRTTPAMLSRGLGLSLRWAWRCMLSAVNPVSEDSTESESPIATDMLNEQITLST
eukprot:CAMPEP_0204009370 /NCGR_PEP_ID=MMETSP0360-20130528/21796_1 /ASSEMBLY_ACC=CAM_ASM_000342 /TAXON_ID=268821 /ORGANISM="Scrippsiella Hangoei, Strain SHTV-5" /LENGTH=134 /DNA_ID=CAMNT_0050951733 /DNA_START=62 /DNA_END=463 /DNA_ORIENTATION=+